MNLESEGPVTDSIARTTSKEWIFSKKKMIYIFSFNHGGLNNNSQEY